MSLRQLKKVQANRKKKKKIFDRSALKARQAEWIWRVVTNPKLSVFFVALLERMPARLRYFLCKVLRKSFIRSYKIFDVRGQSERAFYIIRVMRVAFKHRFSVPHSKERLFYAQACLKVGALNRLCKERVTIMDHPNYIFTVGQAHLLNGDYQTANELIHQALEFDKRNTEIMRFAGIVQALLGNYKNAETIFKERVFANKNLFTPHQNLAAKFYPQNPEVPINLLRHAGSLQIYDQLNYMGEHFFHYGKLSDSMQAYKAALLHQKKLQQEFTLPQALSTFLHRCSNFKKHCPVAILPTEWVTQIGHIALLDIFLKIEHFERKRECNYVLLAPKSHVANQHYLSYWKRYFCVVEDEGMVKQLSSYQRYVGEGFMPFLKESGEIEPWTRTGARAQYQWHQEKRGPLIKLTEADQSFGRTKLDAMGLPSDGWFVALHIRESSFHKEKGGAGDHRNAHVEDYIAAVKEITARGGWVIRMGDANMVPFPKMEKVIDYAHSEFKSARMDVCLIAMARLFIGTTSGLTTAALSFDQSALLVNVISNDWQLWTGKTHFIPKMIFDARSKRMLTLANLYISENRDLLFKRELMNRKKWEVVVNSSEDILEAVKYKLDVMQEKDHLTQDQKEMCQLYKTHMAEEPYMFGASQIVPHFLEKHPYLVASTPKQFTEPCSTL